MYPGFQRLTFYIIFERHQYITISSLLSIISLICQACLIFLSNFDTNDCCYWEMVSSPWDATGGCVILNSISWGHRNLAAAIILWRLGYCLFVLMVLDTLLINWFVWCSYQMAWWCSDMEMASTLLALCVGNPLDSPHKGPVMWSFCVNFVTSLNKLLNNAVSHHDGMISTVKCMTVVSPVH